jgi:hypothetical protein
MSKFSDEYVHININEMIIIYFMVYKINDI